MKLTLDDLQPTESTFSLSHLPGKVFTLKKFSLASRIWAKQRFGDGLKDIFQDKKIAEICELAFFLMKDKTGFADFNAFAESVVTVADQIEIMRAMLATVGISQPVIEKLVNEAEAEVKKAMLPSP